jgi:hypothetical protein
VVALGVQAEKCVREEKRVEAGGRGFMAPGLRETPAPGNSPQQRIARRGKRQNLLDSATNRIPAPANNHHQYIAQPTAAVTDQRGLDILDCTPSWLESGATIFSVHATLEP